MEENTVKSKYNNYSKIDGKLNIKNRVNYFTLEKNNICGNCNSLADKEDIYCKNCGELLQVVKNKNNNFINQEEKNTFRNIAISFNWINGLKASALALGILFILSVVMKYTLIGGSNQISSLINPIHLMLFSNLSSVDIYMSLFMNSSQSSINIGFLILMVLPIISFILPYRIFIKNNNTSLANHLKNSVCISLIYAIGLAILAKVSQVGINLSSSYNQFMSFGQYNYGIYFSFSILSTFLKGFIIGFATIFFMGLKKEYTKENYIVKILKISLNTLLICYILSLIILVILHFANINYVYEFGLNSYIDMVTLPVVLIQLAVYLWAFANLIPIKLGIGTISIISLFNSSLSLDIILILGALVALSALIFIIVGCRLQKNKSNDIKPVIVFSISYAILVSILGFITTLYIGDNVSSMISSLGSMQIGFNFIIGGVISFAYSFIMTLVGYKLNIFN